VLLIHLVRYADPYDSCSDFSIDIQMPSDYHKTSAVITKIDDVKSYGGFFSLRYGDHLNAFFLLQGITHLHIS